MDKANGCYCIHNNQMWVFLNDSGHAVLIPAGTCFPEENQGVVFKLPVFDDQRGNGSSGFGVEDHIMTQA
jgi:hypothetical protein